MTTDNRANEPTDEQVEAAAKAIADCHNPGMFEKYPENWRVEARAALVAATHVPVQGEPNDDRGTLMEAMKRGEKVRQAAWSAYGQEPDGEGTKPHSDNWYRAEALMAAGFSRATVPDAATPQKAEAKIADLVYENASLKAERDAAVAALERVRAIHRQLPVVSTGFPPLTADSVYCANGCDAPCETGAALDGAPEPEWEWGYAGETLVGVYAAVSREAADEDVANLRRYWKDERKFWVARRTPASEWLPVEGEGKP